MLTLNKLLYSRIGPAPSLSLLPVNQTLPSRVEPSRGRPSDIIAATLPINRANSDFNNAQNRLGMYNTVAGGASSAAPRISGDDHGYGSPMSLGRGLDDFGSSKPIISVNSTSTGASLTSATNTNTLPSAMRNTSAPRNLHVKNGEVTPESVSRNRSGQATGSNFAGSSTSQSNWPTAEEEKRRYEQARDGVIKVHGPESAPVRCLHISMHTSYNDIGLASRINAANISCPRDYLFPASWCAGGFCCLQTISLGRRRKANAVRASSEGRPSQAGTGSRRQS